MYGELKMSENENKNEGQSCCCCKCWKTIFITIALLAIGAVFGHVMTVKHHCGMMGGPGGCCMKACWDKDKDGMEHHGMWGHKPLPPACKPGCMCPVCSKKKSCCAPVSDPNKPVCPMTEKGQGKDKK
jgi:hypothetical protein